MAAAYGIREYPTPAGGCLLTDKGFCTRLKDLFDHQLTYPEAALQLLKYGRHFRLDPDTKIVVGRTQSDNEQIARHIDPQADSVFKVNHYPGPLVVMPSGGSPEAVRTAAAICVGYSRAPNDLPVEVTIRSPEGVSTVSVQGLAPEAVRDLII